MPDFASCYFLAAATITVGFDIYLEVPITSGGKEIGLRTDDSTVHFELSVTTANDEVRVL